MHLLCKYDVAPFGRNDAMFAQCAVRHTSLGVTVIIGRSPASFCRKVRKANFGKHHSKNAPLSVDKSAFFVGGEAEIRTLEPFYRLHDFQSCALDQLGDFSISVEYLCIISQQIEKIKSFFKKILFF